MADFFSQHENQYTVQRSRDSGVCIKPGAFVVAPKHDLIAHGKVWQYPGRWRRGILIWNHVGVWSPRRGMTKIERKSRRTATPRQSDPSSAEEASEVFHPEVAVSTIEHAIDFTLCGPDSASHVGMLTLEKDEVFVFKPEHLLGFSDNISVRCRYRFRLLSFLLHRYANWYVGGPAEVYFFGMGGIETIEIDGHHAIGGRHVIGWTNSLQLSATAMQGLRSQILGSGELLQWNFSGRGLLLTQGSTETAPRHLPTGDRSWRWIDFVSLLTGSLG